MILIYIKDGIFTNTGGCDFRKFSAQNIQKWSFDFRRSSKKRIVGIEIIEL
jgi:hypothetical protein